MTVRNLMMITRCWNLRADFAPQTIGGERIPRRADERLRLRKRRNRAVVRIHGKVGAPVVERLGEDVLRIQRRLMRSIVFELREVLTVAAANGGSIVELEIHADSRGKVVQIVRSLP